VKHYYAIDLESWVYPDVEDFRQLNRDERKRLDNGYIVESTHKLLALLSKHSAKLTFFVIGEIYEWYPDLIREIKKAGHEIAYHTHTHILLRNVSAIEGQLQLSKRFLKEFRPKGFQAPMVHFPREGYKLLKKSGIAYSSSVYSADVAKEIVDGVMEFPVSSYKLFGGGKALSWPRSMGIRNLLGEIPFGSSYLVAILGGRGIGYFIKEFEKANRSAVLFIHNWQLFPPENASYPDFRFLLKHPLYIPYVKDVRKDFEYLLDNFEFGKLEEAVR
jgi:hypothetical protein